MTDDTEKQEHTVLTMEAINDDWWHAVYLPLPDAPTGELIEEAHFVVQYCFHGARARAADPEASWCNPHEPGLSAYADKGDAPQHAEAALERLHELEGRWAHYLDRMKNAPDIPESVEALREELQQRTQDRADRMREEEVSKARASDHEAHTQSPDTSMAPGDRFIEEESPDQSHDDGLDMDFSRGPSGRGR